MRSSHGQWQTRRRGRSVDGNRDITMGTSERWPPVYDANDLIQEIKRLTERENLEGLFYDWRRDRSVKLPEDVCQGDVVQLACDVPVVNGAGEAEATEHPTAAWLVIGNTCDFARTTQDAQWTQLVPIIGLTGPVTASESSALRRYSQSRRFYLPSWTSHAGTRDHVADFLRPVAVDKRVFEEGVAKVDARMSRPAWVLLNACLVRFLARDDGRFDG